MLGSWQYSVSFVLQPGAATVTSTNLETAEQYVAEVHACITLLICSVCIFNVVNWVRYCCWRDSVKQSAFLLSGIRIPSVRNHDSFCQESGFLLSESGFLLSGISIPSVRNQLSDEEMMTYIGCVLCGHGAFPSVLSHCCCLDAATETASDL